MDLRAIEVIETEHPLEETMSLNHSRLTFRLSYLLAQYDDEFDIMPELELELSTGRSKPDIAIFPNLQYNWEEDIIRFTQAPITAIEILSPTQAFDELTTKIRKTYFPAGVRSAWIVVPSIKTIHVFTTDRQVLTFKDGSLLDKTTNISLLMSEIFK